MHSWIKHKFVTLKKWISTIATKRSHQVGMYEQPIKQLERKSNYQHPSIRLYSKN